jgi:hypothetical protein
MNTSLSSGDTINNMCTLCIFGFRSIASFFPAMSRVQKNCWINSSCLSSIVLVMDSLAWIFAIYNETKFQKAILVF